MTDKTFNTARARFNRAYDDLFTLVACYPPDQTDKPGACGKWSPRQILAHFSGWVYRAIDTFDAYEAGDQLPGVDPDTYNDEQVAHRAHLGWAGTIDNVKTARDALNRRVATIDPDSLDMTYIGWLVGLAKDAERHMVELRNFKSHD